MTLIGKMEGAGGRETGQVFQSLFSWMTLIGIFAHEPSQADLSRFNPCFLG